MFGLLNLYVTNVKARHEFTEFVGATMFGTYNVISLVVLLNMLIAMMNNSYQLIAVSYLLLFVLLFLPVCLICLPCSKGVPPGLLEAAAPSFCQQVVGISAHQPESCLQRRFCSVCDAA